MKIGCYEKALAEADFPADGRAVYTYLVGELYRRVGDAREAGEWFDRVAGLVTDPKQEWVVKLAEQQKTEPKEFIGR